MEDIKFSLTIDDIEKVLKYLNASYIKKDNTIISETICHNLPGVGSHKLYYYDNTKLFKCYTQCGDYFDVFDLVRKAIAIQKNEELSLIQSIKLVKKILNIEEDNFEFRTYEQDLCIRYKQIIEDAERTKNYIIQSLPKYDDKILKHLDTLVIEHWEKEGITYDILKKYNISYYPKDQVIIIPHYDINNNLIGIRRRILIQEEVELYGKYMPARIGGTLYTHPTSFNLYGIDKNKDNIKRAKTAIVFEGEKSVMKYEALFGPQNNITVAVCGFTMSLQQFLLLKSLGINEIVIAFDKQFKHIGDNEFKKEVKLLENIAKKFSPYVNISIIFDKYNLLDYKDSPVDKGKDVFIHLYKNRIFLKEGQ